MSMVAERGLSFVIPAFNEEEGITRLVDACHDSGSFLQCRGQITEYEIIVVDDGSTDATGRLCDEIESRDHRFRVVRHENNRSLGAAIRSGFEASSGEYILYTDADLPFDLRETDRALRHMRSRGADVVAGFRLSRAGEGMRRMVYSYLYNALIRAAFGTRVRDINFAAKLLRREVLESIDLRSESSFIDAELMIRSERAGFQIVQFGLGYFPRSHGTSTLSSMQVIREMLREMVALAPELRSLERDR